MQYFFPLGGHPMEMTWNHNVLNETFSIITSRELLLYPPKIWSYDAIEWVKISKPVANLISRSNFFDFHAVVTRIWPNNRLVPSPLELVYPLREILDTPLQAPFLVMTKLWIHYSQWKTTNCEGDLFQSKNSVILCEEDTIKTWRTEDKVARNTQKTKRSWRTNDWEKDDVFAQKAAMNSVRRRA